ncbi:MAG: hypothetical protein RLZZ450_1879 [Pseudomonadota bacterium]
MFQRAHESAIKLCGAPAPEPRLVRGNAKDALLDAWSKADVFITSLPSVGISDAAQLGQRKMRAIRAALAAWPALI